MDDYTYKDIRFHEDRNRLLRVLGKESDLRPVIHETPCGVKSGDAFLLCTDGFWEYIDETEMETGLTEAASPDEWLEKMEARLLAQAEEKHDNYTAIAIFAL